MKKLNWVGISLKDLRQFPKEAIQEVGYALHLAQNGQHYDKAKPFKGCGSGVYEIAIEFDKNAYRTIYILNLDDAIYVVHCFQKKSTRGIKTPKKAVDLIKSRINLLKLERKRGKSDE